jgi:hypothetical protein
MAPGPAATEALDDHGEQGLHLRGRPGRRLGPAAVGVGDVVLGRGRHAALASRRMPAAPGHDIDDPYRRGAEEAARAAVTMEEGLEVVVDRLRRLPQTGDSP